MKNYIAASLTRSSLGHPRNKIGAGIIVIVFICAFLILFAFGIFSFEVQRVNAARDELRSACEAASLAGAAALASSNTPDTAGTHDLAEQAAQQAFVTNSILGNLLSNTTFSNSKTSDAAAAVAQDPAKNASHFYVEYLKQDGTVAGWTDPEGRVLHVIAVFGEQPSFGSFINVGKVNVNNTSRARVPQMDIVMCFDVSGSIDDQTVVTVVRRQRDPADATKNKYTVVRNGTIYSAFSPPATGTSLNAIPPQGLEQATTNSLNFSPTMRGSGGSDAGTRPGTPGFNNDTFTDVVVNPTGSNPFASKTVLLNGLSYPFPSLGALVEASRGNLEDAALYASSGAQATLGNTVTPTAGYKAAYLSQAQTMSQPINAARQAASNFFTIMNNNTDATFGFVGFDNSSPYGPATTPAHLNAQYGVIASNYAPGGNFNPPYPGQALGANNFATITQNVIPLTRAAGCTCMGDALNEAVQELITSGRPGTQKAVIMFTDGQPTCGQAWNNAANTAKTKGIAVYTIGLAQNSAIIPAECNNLNDDKTKPVSYTDPVSGAAQTYTPSQDGMAAVAGNGGKFFLVVNSANLNFVFENIARQLVQLSKG